MEKNEKIVYQYLCDVHDRIDIAPPHYKKPSKLSIPGFGTMSYALCPAVNTMVKRTGLTESQIELAIISLQKNSYLIKKKTNPPSSWIRKEENGYKEDHPLLGKSVFISPGFNHFFLLPMYNG